MRTVDAPCLQAAAQAPSKACLQMRTQLLAIASTEKTVLWNLASQNQMSKG